MSEQNRESELTGVSEQNGESEQTKFYKQT